MLADQLEDSIRSCGWRIEAPLGTEAELAAGLHAGRRTIRQAGRILSARGAIQVRRGKVGGFFVSQVDRETATSGLTAALGAIPDLPRRIWEARQCLDPILKGRNGCAHSLLRNWLDVLTRGGSDRPVEAAPTAVRAQRLAHAIVHDFTVNIPGQESVAIGSLWSLAERYSSGLPVVVEAVRLLEDDGIVSSRRGRTGGIVLLSGGGVAPLRLVNVYLGSNGATIEECRELVCAINLAMLDLTHGSEDAVAREAVDRALQGMEHAATPTEVGVAWYLLQRSLCDLADNPILHLLVRSLSAHLVLRRLSQADLTAHQARDLMHFSRRIVADVRQRKALGGHEAHLRCQQVLEQCW
jgi:DNA-binding FadR family transcriptional regulator